MDHTSERRRAASDASPCCRPPDWMSSSIIVTQQQVESRRRLFMDVVEVTVGGATLRLSRDAVIRAVAPGGFGPVRQHAVEVEGARYPVKEVFARATGLNRLDFNTVQARGTLRRL